MRPGSSRRRAAITARASPSRSAPRPAGDYRRASRQFSREEPAMRALGAELVEHGVDFQAAREEAERRAERDGLEIDPRSTATSCSASPPMRSNYCARRPISTFSTYRSGRAPASAAASWRETCSGSEPRSSACSRPGRPPTRCRSRPAGRNDRNQQHTGRRHGNARSRSRGVRDHPQGRFPHRAGRDDEIAAAIRAYWTDTHNLAEGAGAAALAAALQEKRNFRQAVGIVLSGGNIDFDLFHRWVGPDAMAADQRAMA